MHFAVSQKLDWSQLTWLIRQSAIVAIHSMPLANCLLMPWWPKWQLESGTAIWKEGHSCTFSLSMEQYSTQERKDKLILANWHWATCNSYNICGPAESRTGEKHNCKMTVYPSIVFKNICQCFLRATQRVGHTKTDLWANLKPHLGRNSCSNNFKTFLADCSLNKGQCDVLFQTVDNLRDKTLVLAKILPSKVDVSH